MRDEVRARTGYVTTGRAAKYLGLSKSILEKYGVTGGGPEFFSLERVQAHFRKG